MNEMSWYASLIKPSWAPPSWLFGPVWSFLYCIIALSFGTVFYQAYRKKIPWLIALPFLLNLIFNAAFSPLQFIVKNNYLAAIDILLVLGTLIWALVGIYRLRRFRWIAYVNIPYLLWVCFASVLQLTVTYLNA